MMPLLMMMGGETWANLGSIAAGMMFVWAMYRQYFPHDLREPIEKYAHKLMSFVYPYVQITFHEYSGDGFERSKVYVAIERYLAKNSTNHAKRLKADVAYGSDAVLVFSMDDHEEVVDNFQNGVKLWWSSNQNITQRQSISFYPREDEKRYYKLKFHKKNRDLVTNTYLKHVLDEGKAIQVMTRQRKLYTNSKNDGGYSYRRKMWSHVKFEHPSNFNTLAMDPIKKKEIINDLIKFSQSKDYYTQIGKAWKRGYLLYGPPGTGKSSMIAAMANLLEYDVYDLELTAVKDNTELRKLLIDTSSKSIVVIEDIDCSLDLTGQRKKENEEKDDDKEKEKEKELAKMKPEEKDSKVTLSGLLNFIDGLWSSCGGERIIVFTTNYKEKLDPALIRRGRMDKHVELSYCGFEAFKILAKNYMGIESHKLFTTIEKKLKEVNMTPADVAENLMPKSEEDDADSCLEGLIVAMDKAKEDAIKLKAEEEEQRLKKEEDEKKDKEKDKDKDKEKSEKDKEKSEKGTCNCNCCCCCKEKEK
ncbi:AAA-ATPase ASD, mitochondrial-like [Impatiens glandulifera]|uniref:AAA-ATPase ASD, mitochondrial-like n=1 Tax=Impatiens glandulifera TaxID=253017 RepID=UPI001FB164AF|nr:AAA-ATPase ASD, mitochondrial-like [Impatiens glandulifera]